MTVYPDEADPEIKTEYIFPAEKSDGGKVTKVEDSPEGETPIAMLPAVTSV